MSKYQEDEQMIKSLDNEIQKTLPDKQSNNPTDKQSKEFKTPSYQRKAYNAYYARTLLDVEKTKKRKARQKAYYQKNKLKKLKKSTPDIIEIKEMKPTTIEVDFN